MIATAVSDGNGDDNAMLIYLSAVHCSNPRMCSHAKLSELRKQIVAVSKAALHSIAPAMLLHQSMHMMLKKELVKRSLRCIRLGNELLHYGNLNGRCVDVKLEGAEVFDRA